MRKLQRSQNEAQREKVVRRHPPQIRSMRMTTQIDQVFIDTLVSANSSSSPRTLDGVGAGLTCQRCTLQERHYSSSKHSTLPTWYFARYLQQLQGPSTWCSCSYCITKVISCHNGWGSSDCTREYSTNGGVVFGMSWRVLHSTSPRR